MGSDWRSSRQHLAPLLVATAPRFALLSCLCGVLVSCGRFGFVAHDGEGAQRDSAQPPTTDAAPSGVSAERTSVHPASNDSTIVDASLGDAEVVLLDGQTDAFASLPPMQTSDAQSPPTFTTDGAVVDPGCDVDHPRRLWPVSADVATCFDSVGTELGTTGVGAVPWTVYGGCPIWVRFAVEPGREVVVHSYGDGCQCAGCSLWHIHYVLEEFVPQGRDLQFEVSVADDLQCPDGSEQEDRTPYTPVTAELQLRALDGTTGAGFYYTVCAP